MHVGIDLTGLLPVPTGVENYVTSLVLSLARIDTENRYTLFMNVEDRNLFAGALPPNFNAVHACMRPRPVRFIFQQMLLPCASGVSALDVLHSPAFLAPIIRGRPRHLLTVHDMTMFTMPALHNRLRRNGLFLRGVTASIRRADIVNVPSEATRQDLLTLMPEVAPHRVRVIPHGIGEEFRPDPAASLAVLRVLSRPYILFVGTIEPRKGVETLVASYRQLVLSGGIEEDLVLAGRLGWGYHGLLAQIEASELRGRVHRLGYVPQTEIVRLYSGARLFVYPSLGEGFGFPPLEAMACGAPTIATDSSSLTENLRGAAELVEPGNVGALAAAMRRILRDPALRATLRTAGLARAACFRWDEAARRTCACYQELAC